MRHISKNVCMHVHMHADLIHGYFVNENSHNIQTYPAGLRGPQSCPKFVQQVVQHAPYKAHAYTQTQHMHIHVYAYRVVEGACRDPLRKCAKNCRQKAKVVSKSRTEAGVWNICMHTASVHV